MPHWKVRRLANGLGEHAAAWDALNRRLFNAHPILDSRFVDGLLKHFGNGSEHLCVLESDGAPEAMCVLRPRGFGIWTTFLPSQAQIGPVLIQKPDVLWQLMRSLPGVVTRLDLLCNDPVFGDLSTAGHGASTRTDHALTMNVRLEGDFKSYWAARSKKLVQNIGRYERRLATDNVARQLRCITDPKDISAAVARYATLESTGWKGKLGTAVGVNNSQGVFYTELMNRFAASRNAMVYELWFDDHLVASRLIIASEDMIIMVKTTYDEAFDKYAPGRLLLHDVIQSLFATAPGKAIEFYTDANADQLAWATGQRWIQHVTFYRTPLTASIYSLIRAGRQALATSRASPEKNLDAVSVEVFRHLDELPSDIQQLFARAEHKNFESGVSWYTNLVSSVYSDNDSLRIYVLRKKGQPVAALPVLIQSTFLGQRVESLSNYYTSIYTPIIESEVTAQDLVPLVKAMRDTHSPLGSLRFSPMDPDSTTFRTLLSALQTAGMPSFRFFCFGNWFLPVATDWQSYLSNREGKLRNTLKRRGKEFTAAGGNLELIRGDTELERGLKAYERVYAASWKHPEPYPNFVPNLVRTCAKRGWLRLGIAWLNGEAVAAQIWIVANGKANIYKLAFDANHKAFAPGTLLTAMLMQHSFESDHVTEVDYLMGDDPYKKSWMSHRRERWGVVAYNPKSVSGLFGLGREVLGRALKPSFVRLRTLMTTLRKTRRIQG